MLGEPCGLKAANAGERGFVRCQRKFKASSHWLGLSFMQKMRHDIKSTWGSAALGSLYGPVKSSLGGAEPPLSDTRSNFLMIRVAGAQALTAFPGHSNTSLSRWGQEASLFSGAAESGGCLTRCPRPLLGLHPSVCKVSQSLDMRRVSALPLGEGCYTPPVILLLAHPLETNVLIRTGLGSISCCFSL